MKVQYQCPKCEAYLRVRDNIILTVKSPVSGSQGVVLLHPELGNYTFLVHPNLHFEKGEACEFHCPVCFENLAAREINDNLVRIVMTDGNGVQFDVYFSRIAGERSTFKVENRDIIETFGEDSSGYMAYFSRRLEESIKTR